MLLSTLALTSLLLAGDPMAVADDIRKDSRATVVVVAVFSGVNVSTGATASFSLSTHDLGAPKWGVPAASLPLPGLRVSRAADVSLVQGATLGGLASIDDVELTYAGQRLRDGVWTTDQFEPYEFEGRDVVLYWLGQTADGRVLDWTNKLTWFDGVFGDGGGWSPHQLTLLVRARGANLDAELAGTYRGTPYALAYDGVNDEVNFGNILNPTGSFSYQITFYAEAPPASGAVTQRLLDKSKHWIEYDATTAASPVLRWHVEVGGTTLEPTVAIPTYHRFYTVTCSYNASTGVARVRHDGSSTVGTATKSGGGNPDTDASTLYLGRQSSAAAKYYDGVIGQAARWSAALTEAEELEYAAAALAGDETSLVALWTGVRNLAGTKLVDTGPSYDPATATSPYDGTITGAIEATTFDGGTDIAGTAKRSLLGDVQNVRGVPVYSPLNIFQLSDAESHIPIAVRDAGVNVSLDAFSQRIYPFFATAPAATKYTWFPFASAVRLADKQSFGSVAADMSGACVRGAAFTKADGIIQQPPSRGLYLDQGLLAFGGSFSSLFYSSYTLEMKINYRDIASVKTVIFNFGNGTGYSVNINYDTSGNLVVAYTLLGSGATEDVIPMPMDRPMTLSFVVTDSGSIDYVLYLDGVEVLSVSRAGSLSSSGTGTGSAKIGTAGTSFAPFMTVEEVRFWSSARTESQIRDDLYAATPSSTPTHWYKPPLTTSPTTWVDSGSGTAANATITDGDWGGGAGLDTTRQVVRYLLLQAAVEESAIDLDEAWEIAPAEIGIVVEGARVDPAAEDSAARSGGSVRGAISDALSSLACALVYDRSVASPGRWVLRQIVDPDSVSAALTITEDQVKSIGVPRTTKPPQRISLAYAPVDLVQDDSDLVSTASATLRQLVSKPFRYLERAIPGNVSKFPLQLKPLRLPGRLRDRSAAKTEIARRVVLAGVRRRVWPIQLVGGPWEHVTPGQVVTVVHRRIPGGSAKFLVVQMTDPGVRGDGRFATLYGWR